MLAPLLVFGSAVSGQQFGLQGGVSSQLGWTSNADLGGSGPAQRDLSVEVRPRLSVRSQGSRLTLTGTAALNASAHTNDATSSRALPEADLQARLEAVERLLFIEAGFRASQTSVNAFGARTEQGSTANTLTATQWRLAPTIDTLAGPDLHVRARSDNTWARQIGAAAATAADAANGYFGRHSVELAHDPRPLGWSAQIERSATRYDSGGQADLNVDVARVTADYALNDELTAGLRAGRERNLFGAVRESRSFGGAQLEWKPTPRTQLSASTERRFFGSAWSAAFSHRTPWLVVTFGLNRGLDTTPQALLQLPPTDNVATLLDAAFTTRYPDPVERAGAVQNYIASQGLPGSLQSATTLYTQRLSVVDSRRVSLAYVGVRNSLALNAFHSSTEDALDAGPLATGSAQTNNLQYGAALTYTHRFEPAVSMSSTLDWARTRGLGAATGQESTQSALRLQLNLEVAPKTNAFAGARYRKLASDTAVSGREGAVFVGIDHRF